MSAASRRFFDLLDRLDVRPGDTVYLHTSFSRLGHLGLGADGYGALFGALGVGAILGAVVLGRVTSRLSTNAVLGAGGTLYAGALAVVILVPGFLGALVVLILSGMAWMAVTSTLQAELQLALPAWVRARGVAVYTVTFMGSQTAGALIWGFAAQRAGLEPAVLAAAVVGLAGVVAGMFWRVRETGHLDPSPAAVYWVDPQLAVDPEPDTGPVLVAVHYTVVAERQTAFVEAPVGRFVASGLLGLSMNRIAQRLGVSTPTIQAWLEQFAAAYAQKPEPEGRAVVIELDEIWHYLKKSPSRCGSGKLGIVLQGDWWTGNAAIVTRPPASA